MDKYFQTSLLLVALLAGCGDKVCYDELYLVTTNLNNSLRISTLTDSKEATKETSSLTKTELFQ